MSALAFLTTLGRSSAPDARTLRWFPLVGALLGAIVAVAHRGTHALWPPLVAGGIVLALDLVLTGALHLDGLADSADGLLPHMDRPRRLAVMSEPDVGAFGLAAVISVLLLRWAVLAEPGLESGALIALWAVSRTAAAVVPALVPYARRKGLATPFLQGASIWLALWFIPAAGLLVVVGGVAGAIASIATVLGAGGIVALAWRRLGGFTGDVLGAAILLGETTGLLVIAAQP